MTTQTIVLYVVAGVLLLVYMLRRRSRLNSEE
jgi:hypothetical protein